MGRKYKAQKKRGANDVIKKKKTSMSKRKNDDESNEKAHQQKRSDVDSKQIAVAVDTRNQVNASPILKLNAICCDDLFDWLSSEDLHSLGQTCKRMKQLTGVYLRDNLNIVLSGFEFPQSYRCEGYVPYIFAPFVKTVRFNILSQKKDFQYVGKHCDSLRKISFEGKLNKSKIGCIKAKLSKIETIGLFYLEMPSSFNLYDDLLKFCPNLKKLSIQTEENIHKYNKWLCHKFPKLEYFHFNYSYGSSSLSRIFEQFFQKNSHLHFFETGPKFLLDNSDAFIKPNTIKLDLLQISFGNMDNFVDACILLKKLNDSDQKYKFSISSTATQDQINLIGSLRGLEELDVKFKEDLVFPKMISLKKIEIDTFCPLENIHSERIAASFPNLCRIHMYWPLEDQILPFLRLLPKLKEIIIPHRFKHDSGFEGYNLRALNEEREKLSGACKVTIYVAAKYYLITKMALKNLYTKCDLIEMKRYEVIEYRLRET